MTTQIEKEVVNGTSGFNGSEILKTASGDVHVINTNFVDPKVIYAINNFFNTLDGTDNNTYSVIFRMDCYPRINDDTLTTWMHFPDSKASVCNLVDCVDCAFEMSIYGDKHARHLSVRALIWQNLIKGLYHETHHAIEYITRRNELETDKEAALAEEELACEYATDTFANQIKSIDLEPIFAQETEELIALRWNEEVERITLLEKDLKSGVITDKALIKDAENSIEWLVIQKAIIDREVMLLIPPTEEDEERVLHSLKEYIAFTKGISADDPEWRLPTIGMFTPPVETIQEPPIVINPQTTIPVQVHYNQQPVQQYDNTYVDDYDEGIPEPHYEEEYDYSQNPVEVQGFQGVQQFQPQQFIQPIPQPTPQPQYIPTQPPVSQTTYQERSQTMRNNQTTVTGNYAPTGLTDEEMAAVMKNLYLKLYTHIFQNCAFDRNTFTQINNIKTKLGLTNDEMKVIKHITYQDEKGIKLRDQSVTNWISGLLIDNAGTLPGYELCIATPDGTKIRRKLIPQNPYGIRKGVSPSGEKMYTNTAIEARAGHCIMWIIDPDATVSEKPYSTRIYDGVLQSNYTGCWAAIC